MFIWLTGVKIVLYSWFLIRVLQKTPLSFLLIVIVVAVFASGFWRSFYAYAKAKVNVITLLLDLVLAFLISLFPGSAGFDKLFMVYLIEGTALLPKPFYIFYAILAAACSVGSCALQGLRDTGQVELLGIAEIMLYGFAFILVWNERRQREQKLAYENLTKKLEYINLRLNESMSFNESLAFEAERRRIAGEVHDSLGHDLTGLILTLEAGKKLIDCDPTAAKSHWDKALQVSRAALTSVRELVSEKRNIDSEFDLSPRLEEIISDARALTGLQIKLDLKPQGLCLSNKENFILYRIFQEAITNTLRHANAKCAYISISDDRGSVTFSYCDDGVGTNMIEAGNGLKGMKERIAELGGVISFQSRRGEGFEIKGYINRRGAKNEEDKNSAC